jgi:hypothetical protein
MQKIQAIQKRKEKIYPRPKAWEERKRKEKER